MHEPLLNLKFHPSVLALRKARKAITDLAPTWALRLTNDGKRALRDEVEKCMTVEECIDFTRRHMATGSCQIAWEIDAAIQMMATVQPRVLCEIGTRLAAEPLYYSAAFCRQFSR